MVSQESKSIFVALISNGDGTRDQSLMKSLGVFQSLLPENFSINFHRFAEQDAISPHGLKERLFKIRADFSYFSRSLLGQFRNRNRVKSLAILTHMLFLSLKRMVFEIRSADTTTSKRVELTKKHLRAWKGFLETQDNYFLALEDDADFLITNPTEDDRKTLSRLLFEMETSSEGFISSLAKGFPASSLGITLSPLPQNERLFECSPPMVNTAAAYLMNRKLLKQFSNWVSPNDRFTSIDLLINKLAIRKRGGQSEVSLPIRCVHSTPPLFDNGSLSGRYSAMDGVQVMGEA